MKGSAVAKTFFIVVWQKALENMGITVDWNDMERMKADLSTAFSDISPNYYATICKAHDKGIHVHLAISFEKAKRLTAVAKMLGNAHTEIMRGTKDEAIGYVNKDGKYAEKDEVVLETIGSPSNVQDNSGQRLDLNALSLMISSGDINANNLDTKALSLGKTTSQIETIKTYYRQFMLGSKKAKEIRNVKVIYTEGATRSGKTYGAYERFGNDIFMANMTDDKNNFPFDGYLGQKVLLLNELRPGQFKPAYLFQLLEGYPMNLNVKGGHFPALYDTVIITTACPLEEWFKDKDDNKGQDNNQKQFLARIHKHYKTVVDEYKEDGITAKKSHWELVGGMDMLAELNSPTTHEKAHTDTLSNQTVEMSRFDASRAYSEYKAKEEADYVPFKDRLSYEDWLLENHIKIKQGWSSSKDTTSTNP